MNGKQLTRGSLALSFLFASQLFFKMTPALAGEGRPAWQIEWEKTVEAAKKEGQLVLYASEGYEEVFGAFRKKYPEIKVTLGIIYGAESTSRFVAERRAGKYLIDLYINGNTTAFQLHKAKNLAALKPALLLPEVTDQSKWWQGQHHYVDPQGEYIFSFNGQARVEVSYNTNLVNPQEIKSYWDLLNPKWKGKIVGFDPRHPTTGTTTRFLYYHRELGAKYITRLLNEMDIAYSRDGRQMADWLSSHFVVDEELDHKMIAGMRERNEALLAGIPIEELNSGTSESRNWIAAAGALEHLQMELIDYIPLYRTAAGTGCGIAFARWS